MLSLIEAIIIFTLSFGINIIPFFGPSNVFIASLAAINIDNTNFSVVLVIGILVALGATVARIIQYKVTPFISRRLSEEKRATLEANAAKINKRAFLLLCATAATPFPEEPIVISLASMKYNIAKFSMAYFLGKLAITTMGAFMGNTMGNLFSDWLGNVFPNWLTPEIIMTVMSTILAIIVTVILLKVDLSKLANRFRKKSV
ncbi:MAG: hypothetical protein FWC33_00270 [Candidatus Bathyarchaeota archaeon]|nr:hypothetical protein [Candidatus Termiticorpusculum sp.]